MTRVSYSTSPKLLTTTVVTKVLTYLSQSKKLQSLSARLKLITDGLLTIRNTGAGIWTNISLSSYTGITVLSRLNLANLLKRGFLVESSSGTSTIDTNITAVTTNVKTTSTVLEDIGVSSIGANSNITAVTTNVKTTSTVLEDVGVSSIGTNSNITAVTTNVKTTSTVLEDIGVSSIGSNTDYSKLVHNVVTTNFTDVFNVIYNPENYIYTYLEPEGDTDIRIFSGFQNTQTVSFSTQIPRSNTEVYLVNVFDSGTTTGYAKISTYINGTLVGSSQISGTNVLPDSTLFTKAGGFGANELISPTGDVLIYNRILSNSEIQSMSSV